MNFKQFFCESRHTHGTYAAAIPNEATMKKLASWSKKHKITNPVATDDYHTTIIYSRKGVPKAEKHEISMPIKAKITGWKIFDNEGSPPVLVALVESKELQKAYDTYTKAYGAVSDYPVYIPHITFSYDYRLSIPEDLPDFEIVYDYRTFKALDPNWSSKK